MRISFPSNDRSYMDIIRLYVHAVTYYMRHLCGSQRGLKEQLKFGLLVLSPLEQTYVKFRQPSLRHEILHSLPSLHIIFAPFLDSIP